MPDLGSDPIWTAVTVLLTALGLTSASGLRAYIPLLGVALGSHIITPNGTPEVPLSPAFQGLGSTWFIVLVSVLSLAEFGVDKVPGLDHLSDLVHTVVRPLSGALIMAGTANPISNWNPWVAAIIGAVLAFSVHAVKATARPAVTATTVGLGNPLLSLGEDIGVIFMTALSVFLPILAIIILLVVGLLVIPPIIGILRMRNRIRRGRAGAQA